MNKKNKIIITAVCAFFGVAAAFFGFIAIATAFGAEFCKNFEYSITSGKWVTFSLLLWSLILFAVCVIVVLAVLLVSDEKSKKQQVRQRRVKNI